MTATATATTMMAEPQAVPSMEERLARRIRERLEQYRTAVTRHADGERFTERQLEQVAETLDGLGLAGSAWDADAQAIQQHRRLTEREAELAAAEEGNAAKARELRDEIAELEKRLGLLRGEQHRLSSIEPLNRVAVIRRLNELKSQHQHVLADIDAAVAHRQAALEKGGRHEW